MGNLRWLVFRLAFAVTSGFPNGPGGHDGANPRNSNRLALDRL